MAYTTNTSRIIPAGSQNVSTYGADTDARDYGPNTNSGLTGWLTAVASSTDVEFLDVYLESGQTLSVYDDSIDAAIAQSGPRVIRPAGLPGESGWQGHSGTPDSGVGFDGINASNGSAMVISNNIYIYDLLVKSANNGRCFYHSGSSVAVFALCGNILMYQGSTPTGISQACIMSLSTNLTLFCANNIFHGFYRGLSCSCSDVSAVYNNTFVDIVERPTFYSASTPVNKARFINNLYYNFGTAPVYYGVNTNNVTLTSSDHFEDYANLDFHLTAAASEAIGQGSDLSSDTYFDFDDDLSNILRVSWDIGSSSYVVLPSLADLLIARNVTGFKTLDVARNVAGFKAVSIARNIGLVLTSLDLQTARNITGFTVLSAARNIFGFRSLNMSRHIYGAVLGYSNFTSYFKDNIFKAVLGIGSYSPPDLYLGLSTTDPLGDGSGITEPSGNNYSRVLVSSWGTPSEGKISNSSAVRTPRASGSWGDIGYIFWADAATDGNVLGVGRLFSPLSITGDASSGQAIVFQIGSLGLGIEDNIFHGFSNSILQAVTSKTAIPSGDVSYGLSLNTPDPDGTFTEVSATGYNRVTNNDLDFTDAIYTNVSQVGFPVVTSGNDWGTVSDYVIFVDDEPFVFGSMNEETIDYATYGASGFSIAANAIVIEVS